MEWCDGGGVAQREWVDLTNPDAFKSVYVEKKLLWARRVLPSEQNRAVAWPARVSERAAVNYVALQCVRVAREALLLSAVLYPPLI